MYLTFEELAPANATLSLASTHCQKRPKSPSNSSMATAEEIERVSSTLLESFQALSRIEPPMEASPRTMKAFKKLVKTSHQSGGQMFSWAQGMGEALGDEIAAVDDEDAEPLDLHDGQGTWGAFSKLTVFSSY